MLNEVKALLDSAVPLERTGEWQSAIEVCREAFSRSISEQDVGGAIEAILRAGLCYRQTGDRELAAEYLELAAEIASLNGDLGREGRALNGLATLFHMHGELSAAEGLYLRAQKLAQQQGDVLTSGHIELNLGTLAAVRGEIDLAAKHYDGALDEYRSIEHDVGVASVLNNLGMLHLNDRNLTAAETAFNNALSVCRRIGDIVSAGIIQLNRTELHLARGHLEDARASCDEAFEIVSRFGEHSSRTDALRYYGIIYRESGKPYLAETHLQSAIKVAEAHKYPLEEAEAQRELSLVLRQQNRNKEALSALNRAHDLFQGLRAKVKEAEIAKKLGQLEDDFLSLVRSWGESIEAKDLYTGGHCQRVADYACRLAQEFGITERELTWFRMGAFLHDVGKMEIPAEVLNKPGRLDEDERRLIEQHTVFGDEMLSSIEFPWDIRPMVRSHHERWDGTGYPDSLFGREIPLTARILRIADVFDALTTSRSYRGQLHPDEALQIMKDDEGSFDPELFELFLRIYPELRDRIQAAPPIVMGG